MNTNELAPVGGSERIVIMDVLRGFALIGIVFMNIEWFNRSSTELGSFDKDLTGIDHAVGWLIRCFIEGKFYKLFALLFGMGFAVMLLRAQERDKPFAGMFVRRMFVLFIFGLLHMIFLWGGDILHDYAFTGLLLLGLITLFHKKKFFQRFNNQKSILKIGLVWMLFPFVISIFAGIGFGSVFDTDKWQAQQDIQQSVYTQAEALKEEKQYKTPDDYSSLAELMAEIEVYDKALEVEKEEEKKKEENKEVDEKELSPEEQIAKKVEGRLKSHQGRTYSKNKQIFAFSKSSYLEATKYRAKQALNKLKFTPGFALMMLLPIFLLGYWFIYSGVLRNHQQNKVLFRSMAWVGTVFGLWLTISGLLILQYPASKAHDLYQATGSTLFGLGQYVMTAGYLGLIVCMFQSDRWKNKLSKLIPFGRMALTNYIMQTVILVIIFHGYAGGMYGKVSRAPQILIVIAIIVFQIYFSKWWLSKYQFGPLEWVWRCLTYKKKFPIKKIMPIES